MRRWVFAWAWFIAAVLGMGAKGCSESERCKSAREVKRLVCEAAPESASCIAATQAEEDACKPATTPTPATCDPPCPAGQHCLVESVHGNRSGDASTWTEGTMASCVPDGPPPVNCLVVLCPPGKHCDQGIGCVPDPLPDPPPPVVCSPDTIPQVLDGRVVGCLPYPPPEPPVPASACPKPLAPGAYVFVNDKRHGNGIDSTYRIMGDPKLCEIVHGVATNNCHLEGWPKRAECEMELAGGCPIWEYSQDRVHGASCLMAPHPIASCDHHGDPTFRDDPQTPAVFEGRPAECGKQRDAAGNPTAGFFVIGHGLAWFRACLPDGTKCGPWVPGKDNR